MKVTGKEYAFFLAALEREASRNWARRLKALAMESDISPTMLSAILKEKNKASFETQVKLAEACGYSYPEFLIFGRKLIEGEKTVRPISKVPEELIEKLSALDSQTLEFISACLETFWVRSNAKKENKPDS